MAGQTDRPQTNIGRHTCRVTDTLTYKQTIRHTDKDRQTYTQIKDPPKQWGPQKKLGIHNFENVDQRALPIPNFLCGSPTKFVDHRKKWGSVGLGLHAQDIPGTAHSMV